MEEYDQSSSRDPSFWVPGTLTLEDLQQSRHSIILHPVPTNDPNDPLNWPIWRKALNFGLVSFYVLMTFVQLDIGFTAWEQYQTELGFSVDLMNGAAAVNYAALAVGCIFFVPLVHKFGRRPLYLFSTAIQFASCVWFAETYTKGDLIGSNLISGLGGAISETIVQITIADLFFVHQHGAMNGWYLVATFTGAYLGPVASGYIVDNQGWRWMWWWCVILFGANLIAIVFLFEESKFIGAIQGMRESDLVSTGQPRQTDQEQNTNENDSTTLDRDAKKMDDGVTLAPTASVVQIDPSKKLKSYRERMAWITKTDGSIWKDFYQPAVVLFTFPAIAYTAVTFGSLLASFAILISVQATYLFYEPYNFSAAGVGLMNLPPFIGSVLGTFFGGYLNDKSILWLCRRNGGIYEPEMRLWLALPSAVIIPAGILMFGLGLNAGSPWPVLAVGLGIFGFGFMIASDIALSYVMDCYQDIIGNALVGIVFTRNVLSVVVLFSLTPWINGMGLQNMHILVSVISFVLLLLPIPLLRWGKKARRVNAKAYRDMALRQPTHRDFMG